MDRDLLKSLFHRTVIVAGLGYFVDIYDLLLFSMVSFTSLTELGIPQPQQAGIVADLLMWQMGGMLIGGVLWGIIGDKKGRLTVLFGSITLYSIANIANGFVTTIPMYASFRFIAGIGLAGELGAGITLVAEVLKKEHRGYGTALVSAIGIFGAVVGGFVALIFNWRVAYFVGGGLGLILLVTRISMAESLMFDKSKVAGVVRGDVWMILGNWSRASRFIRTTLVGLPIWCLIAIFVTLSPAVSLDLGIVGVRSLFTVQWFYAGAALGGLFWGSLSQYIKSRKNTTIMALSFMATFVFAYFFAVGAPTIVFYVICAFMGFGTGYWAVFVTMAAEQFGTNLRATVATTVPNMIRGTTVPILFVYKFFSPTLGLASTAMVLAAICTVIALFAVRSLPETHSKDLNFLETDAVPTPGRAAASSSQTAG